MEKMEMEGTNSSTNEGGKNEFHTEDAKLDMLGESQQESYEESRTFDDGEDIDAETDISEDLALTCLPEVALVQVMEYLNLKERYYLSQTCGLFYDLFSHPQLWQIARIHLLPMGSSNNRNRLTWRLKAVMHKTMKEIVIRFSHLFQHLSLEMSEYVQCFDTFTLQILRELSKECRLTSLSLRLGPVSSNDTMRRRAASYYSNTEDLPQVVTLIRNAVRLKTLRIISWPLHGVNDDNDNANEDEIFQAIMENPKLSSLETLSLFYLEKGQGQWTERTPKLPSPEVTFQVVSHLANLCHLALRSPMLSDELIMELSSSKRKVFKKMEVLIVYATASRYSDGIKIPEISPKAWTMLKKFKPEVQVEFSVLARIPTDQLAILLQPGIPLSAMSIQTYGQCDRALIDMLKEKYKTTLKRFETLCDSIDCDSALVSLVESCYKLEHLVFYGNVSYLSVMKMADILTNRVPNLTEFKFKLSSISTEDIQSDSAVDDDIVVAKDAESEELYLVGVQRWHISETSQHQTRIDEMVASVSQCIGYSWYPV